MTISIYRETSRIRIKDISLYTQNSYYTETVSWKNFRDIILSENAKISICAPWNNLVFNYLLSSWVKYDITSWMWTYTLRWIEDATSK